MGLKSVGKSIAKAAGNAIKSVATKALSNAASKAVSNAVSKNTGKSIGSATSKAGSSASKIISSSANKGSSTTSKSTGKSLAPTLNQAASTISKLTSSVANKSSGGSSSSSGAKSTGKSISSVTSKGTTARNNLTSSASKNVSGGSSSGSTGKSMASALNKGAAVTSALTKAINNLGSNSSVYSDGNKTSIVTKSGEGKYIPGTGIKSGGKQNYRTYDADGNLIEDIDVSGKGYGTKDPTIEDLYVGESTDDDDEIKINPYEDTMNGAGDIEGQPRTYTQEEVDEMYNKWNEDNNYGLNEAYNQIRELRNSMQNQEEVTPEKSEEEKRLETPAFNQFSWNSYVENRPAELSPVSVPNPNDPLTDPTSYDAPITEALNKLGADINMGTPQQVDNAANINSMNEATGAPQYNGDINSTMQGYNNVFSNIENRGINASSAREFAQAYNNAKTDIERYVQENGLSQQEYERLLAQLRNHPLISQLSNNQGQRKK